MHHMSVIFFICAMDSHYMRQKARSTAPKETLEDEVLQGALLTQNRETVESRKR